MKRIFLQIILLVAVASMGVQTIVAQTMTVKGGHEHFDGSTYYVVWKLDKRTLNYYSWNGEKEIYFTLTGPGSSLSFNAWEERNATKNIVVQETNGTELLNFAPSTTPQKKTAPISSYEIRELKFSEGATKNKYIEQVKVTMAQYLTPPSSNTLQFKDADNRDKYVVLDGTATTPASFAFDWCNVGNITVTLKDNGVSGAANQYTVKVKNIDQADKSITGHNSSVLLGNSAGKWGNATIEVVYNHSKWGDHPAIVTVSTGDKSFDIQLTGKTLGYEQALGWWTEEDPYIMTMDEVIEKAAMITSEMPIQYSILTSGGNAYITLDANGKLTPKAATPAGTQITIQASQAGDEYYAPATSITKKIEVSNKQRQDVKWDQSFLGIKVSEDPSVYQRIPLTAVFTLSPVTYTSSDETIAKIEGNATDGYELVILNVKGRATITAYQAGNDNYIPATATKELRVSDGKRGCEDLVATKDYESLFTEITSISGVPGEEIELYGVPHKVSFEAASDVWKFVITYQPSGNLELRQYCYRDDAWGWHDVASMTLEVDNWKSFEYELDPTATKIQFYKKVGATCYHNYRNLEVTRKRFQKTTTTSIDFNTLPVESYEPRTVDIEYSNIPTALTVEIQGADAAHFIPMQTTLGSGCGETGTATIQVVYNPQAVGEHTAELVIRDPEPEKETAENRINEIRIPLTGMATKKPVTITWDQVWNDPKTIDEITFTASATARLPVTYSQTEESKAIATVNATTGELTILQAGTIRIFADAAGNDLYEPATQVAREFTIRTTNYTVENIVVEAIARGHKLSEVLFTADVKDEAGNDLIDGYTYAWDNPEQIMIDAADHNLTFTPNKVNFYASATTKTVHVGVTYRNWLPIVVDNTSTSVVPTETEYANTLYWEMDDALKTAVGASGNYATLASSADITVHGAQYMLLSAEADNWRSFVAPMDVEKAYVIELLPESELEAVSVQEALQAQTAAYANLYNEIMKQTMTDDSKDNLYQIINAYINGRAGAGIYELEHYNGSNAWTYTYYLYESAPTWVLNGDGFAKDWTAVAASGDIMQRGKTYAINFPYCLDCDDYAGWDYWTGKLILLEHKGEQTVQGQHAADTYVAPNPITGIAEHVGNAFFADVQSGSNAFMHNTATDNYELVADTKVRPTTSLLYANIPTKQGKRAVAITRQGEIIWEDDATDNGNSGVVTDLSAVAASTLRVTTQAGGFSVFSSTAQALSIYGIDGRLVYTGTIGAGEAQFFSVNAGMYVVRTATETQKVLAR